MPQSGNRLHGIQMRDANEQAILGGGFVRYLRISLWLAPPASVERPAREQRAARAEVTSTLRAHKLGRQRIKR